MKWLLLALALWLTTPAPNPACLIAAPYHCDQPR